MPSIFLIFYIFFLSFAYAEEDDIFKEIPLEMDKDYFDDFAGIETNKVNSTYTIKSHKINDNFFDNQNLLRRENFLSLTSGNETFDSLYYFSVFPKISFVVWKIFSQFGLPVRFPLYDNGNLVSLKSRKAGFQQGRSFIVPRPQDFRSFWDTQRIVQYFEIGQPNDAYGLRLSRYDAVSFGQGELLKNLQPEGFYDQDLLFLNAHAEWDHVRLQGFLAPIAKAEMVAVSTRFTPLFNLNAPSFIKDLNVELSYVNDFNALNAPLRDKESFILDDEQRLLKRHRGLAQGMVAGLMGQYPLASWLDLKPYLSFGNLWLFEPRNSEKKDKLFLYGGGLHLGHEATFNLLPSQKTSLLVFKTEGRLFSSTYFPSYFGSTYMIDRRSFTKAPEEKLALTKSEYLAQKQSEPFRFGYLLELGYAHKNLMSVNFGYENAHSFSEARQITPMRKAYFSTTFYGFDRIKFFISYQATALAQIKELFDFDKSRALLSLRGQLKILSFLYFDGWLKHSFGINDMFIKEGDNEMKPIWLSNEAEAKSLNFGLGLELAMTF